MRPMDWMLYPLGLVPVRCKNCGHRTYQRRALWNRKQAEHEQSSKLNET